MADKKPSNKQIPSSMTYPNPYAEGEFFTPDNVQLGQETIRKNIPLGIGMPQSTSSQAMPSDNVIRNAGLRMTPEEPVSSEDDTNFLGSLIAQGVAGIGTGLMGGTPRDIANSANMFQYMRDQQTKRNKSDLLMDPKSEESKKRRLVFKNLGYDVPEDLSYTDLGDSDVLRSLRSKQMEQPKLAGSTRQGGVSGVGGGVEKRKEEQPKERKLSQDERQLLNNSAMAYKALFDLEDAIKRKVPKVTVAGDNDYTFAANRFGEGLGRMQSGGAIGTEEEKKFLKLIPGVFDTEDTANKKIKTMKTDLEARLKSIGYDPKTILESRSYTEDEISPSEQDQAIKWANQNINSKDENNRLKAEKILKGR